MSGTRSKIIAAAVAAALISGTLVSFARPPVARNAVSRSTHTPPSPIVIAPAAAANPLLPKQVDMTALFPPMLPTQNDPVLAPNGITPLYTKEDWTAYTKIVTQESASSGQRRITAGNELAARLIAAAEVETHPGVRRLLLVRAVAMTYRNRDGWNQAGKALASFQRTMDYNNAAQLAALWTMTDTLSKYSTTPKAQRIECSAIAAKANIQLSLMMLDWGQLDAAQLLIKKATYHEGWLKNDARIRAQIAAARGTINSTASMMEYLRGQYDAVVKNRDEHAAYQLFLYARFARYSPGIVADLQTRRSAREIQSLSQMLAEADAGKNPLAAFTAADTLRQSASNLPEGMLRHRVMYAAMHYYRLFMRDPATETERVKRTLAQIQIQNLAADGARGPTNIRPFEVPASATQPARTADAPARPTPPISRGAQARPVG
jgi:hypothetical protein